MKKINEIFKNLNKDIILIIFLTILDSLISRIYILFIYLIVKILNKKLTDKQILIVLISSLVFSFINYDPIGLQSFILGIISVSYVAFKRIIEKSIIFELIWTILSLYLFISMTIMLTPLAIENKFIFDLKIPLSTFFLNFVLILISWLIAFIFDIKTKERIIKV